MAPFLASASLALLTASAPKIILEVCVSPGCIADGAPLALERLSALVPSSIEVKQGTCQSLCGKGPIVILNSNNQKTVHRRIKHDSLLKFLHEGFGIAVPIGLVAAFDLFEQAEQAANEKAYDKAIELYKEGITKANSEITEGFAKAWLSKANRRLAEAQLAVGNVDNASESIQEAMKISADELSLEVLVSICNQKNDSVAEYEALSSLLSLPQESLPRDVANRRRTQSFRLQKLQRELGKK